MPRSRARRGLVRAVGLLLAQRRGSAADRNSQKRLGSRGRRRSSRPPSGRRSPKSRFPGVRKSGIPRHRDPRSGEGDRRGSSRGSARRATASVMVSVSPRWCSLTLPIRLRFRGTRAMPSGRPRSGTRPRSPPSRPRCPRRYRPRGETCLICSTATGAWPASSRAQSSAVSNSSWSGTTRWTSPYSRASAP